MAGCEPAPTRPVSTRISKPASERHEQGRSHLASLLNYWLRQSGFSHEQLGSLADWGLGESGWLIPSQISHIKGRRLTRGLPAKACDAMAAANRAIWLWHEQKPEAAIKELGPHSSWGVTEETLEQAVWLPSEEKQGQPLDFCDFARLSAGWLRLSYLGTMALSDNEAADLSQRLSALLNALVEGTTPAAAMQRILDAYPITDDQTRAEGVRDLLLGGHWSRAHLEAELYAMAVTVATLRGVPLSSYGPIELHAELARDRRRV